MAAMAAKRSFCGVGAGMGIASAGWFAAMVAAHLYWQPLLAIELLPAWGLRIAGAALVIAGWTLYAAAVWQVRRGRRAGTLVTDGLYAHVRHPVYSVHVFLTAPGLALMVRSWALLTVPVFMYVVLRLLIGREEARLEGHFGQAYRDYKRRVPPFFPRPWRWARRRR